MPRYAVQARRQRFPPGEYVCDTHNVVHVGGSVSNLNASIRYEVSGAPGLGSDLHVNVTEVRVTSVTSGLDGAAGIRSGSAGWPE